MNRSFTRDRASKRYSRSTPQQDYASLNRDSWPSIILQGTCRLVLSAHLLTFPIVTIASITTHQTYPIMDVHPLLMFFYTLTTSTITYKRQYLCLGLSCQDFERSTRLPNYVVLDLFSKFTCRLGGKKVSILFEKLQLSTCFYFYYFAWSMVQVSFNFYPLGVFQVACLITSCMRLSG